MRVNHAISECHPIRIIVSLRKSQWGWLVSSWILWCLAGDQIRDHLTILSFDWTRLFNISLLILHLFTLLFFALVHFLFFLKHNFSNFLLIFLICRAADLVDKVCVILPSMLFKLLWFQLRLVVLDWISTTSCFDSVEVFRGWRWLCFVSQIRVCQDEWLRSLSFLVKLCNLKPTAIYLYDLCRLLNLRFFLFILLWRIFFLNNTATITCGLLKQQMIWNIDWQVLIVDLRE